jgi:hypothetical protein
MSNNRPPPRLLAEAGLALVLASLAIRLISFRRLGSALGAAREVPAASASEAALISRALKAWSRRLPWRTMCFEEGVAAHWMLRRHRLASTLHYGAARIDGELKAHVWVRSGETDVTGCETAENYAVLARYPPT